MLPTIDFYDEPFLATDEINDVGSDGLLPDEFKTAVCRAARTTTSFQRWWLDGEGVALIEPSPVAVRA